MIRDSRLTAAIGLWVPGTLLTRRAFMTTASRGIVIAKPARADSPRGKRDGTPSRRPVTTCD